MTTEDLLKELGLDEAPKDVAPAPAGAVPGAAPATPPSPTALKLDKWSIRRGEEALDVPDSLLARIITDRDEDDAPELAELAAADFLAAAFEPQVPALVDRCEDPVRHKYLDQLIQTEEFQGLHTETQLDMLASELAAGSFAQGWMALREKHDEKNPPSDIEALSAAGNALKEAEEAVDDLNNTRRALGIGGDGANAQSMPLDEMRERFQRIRNDGMLRRIIALAGRYRRLAQALQRQKATHGRDDMVGVELGGDLGRLVPSELAALGDDDLEWNALRRLLERGLLCREYRGIEHKGQGPIVVVVDESGSMSGEPIAMAKAFALAMAWVARHQNRWICLVGFSGRTQGTWLTMPPGKWNQEALLEWLSHFFDGGTSMDVPLRQVPERWAELGCPEGITDVIQITDAICNVSPDMATNFLAWKEQTQAKYFTIVLGDGQKDGGDLRQVSDRLWVVPDLSIEQGAVQELMAI